MTATGNNALTVTVWKYPESTLDTGATVSATVTKPDESTQNINFASQGDGNYTYTYNFDANGTWKFNVTTTHSGHTDGTTESYVYVGDFNLLISFVNNGQSVYDRYTGSVRNLVTNEDGNYFTGITGNTTIYYPNSTAWVSSQSMTESGSGEYYYNFTAPTTLGDYTAKSSFTCGANTDSNNQGRFTVVTSCGNGTCDSWESCSTCSADCGTCPATPTTPPGGIGGGGGGGDGVVSTKPENPTILSWVFDETPMAAVPAAIKAKIFNPGTTRNFLLSTKISQAKETLYNETDYVSGVKANETRNVVLSSPFIPKIAGTHTIEFQLFSEDRAELYSELAGTFDIGGIVRYDVAIECLDQLAMASGKASAKIIALNLGDYYKDVELHWWAEDSTGNVFGLASLQLALYSNESRSLVRSIDIPSGSSSGKYYFKAEVSYKGEKTEAECSFLVEEDRDYYEKTLEEKEKTLRKLVEEVQGKKEEGYDVSRIEEMIREARIAVSIIGAKIEQGEFDGLDKEIGELNATIEEIEDAKNELKGFVFLALPFGLAEFMIFATLILLIAVVSILYQFKKLDKLLELEEPKKKKGKRGKKKKETGKKKWKAFEKLLGLQEQKTGKPKKRQAKKRRRKKARKQ